MRVGYRVKCTANIDPIATMGREGVIVNRDRRTGALLVQFGAAEFAEVPWAQLEKLPSEQGAEPQEQSP